MRLLLYELDVGTYMTTYQFSRVYNLLDLRGDSIPFTQFHPKGVVRGD